MSDPFAHIYKHLGAHVETTLEAKPFELAASDELPERRATACVVEPGVLQIQGSQRVPGQNTFANMLEASSFDLLRSDVANCADKGVE